MDRPGRNGDRRRLRRRPDDLVGRDAEIGLPTAFLPSEFFDKDPEVAYWD
jgi:hypothetical protein